MGFYKTRYAKRRSAARYQRKTYKSRYSPKYTPYKKRRFVYNKANKAEWKQSSQIATQQQLTISANSYGTSTSHSMSAINSMATGPNPGQRIGRKLNANFLKIRWNIDLVDSADISSMNVRFIAIQVKGNPDASPNNAPYRPQDFFTTMEVGAVSPSWQLSTLQPFKDGITNSCRILFDKTYKLNANSSTSQVVFRRKIRMQPLKWELASGTTYNSQASNPVFLYWIVSHNTLTTKDTEVPLCTIYRLVYTDS